MDAPDIHPSRLAMLRPGNGNDSARELLFDFAKICAEIGAKLNQASANAKAAEWDGASLELRGGARTMGLVRLADLCQ